MILSENGTLEVCYLGSEPSLFIAPPINQRGFDYVAAENELIELRRQRAQQQQQQGSSNKGIIYIHVDKKSSLRYIYRLTI